MRRIFIFFICLLLAQNMQAQNNTAMPTKSYAVLWKTIDSLEQQGLTKSALESVVPLLAKAETEKNYGQLLRALMYRGKYDIALTENGEQSLVDDWEKRCKTLPQPAQSVLQSMLAQYYTNYMERNRYKMESRTELTEKPSSVVLATSTLGALESRASELYLASLADATAKTTAINDYAQILTSETGTQNLRPTLYDYLAQRALVFFVNEQSYLSEPTYQYELNDATAFAPADAFARHTFVSKNATARKYQAIQIFQQLMKHHVTNLPALLDVDLARLTWAKNTYISEDKSVLYRAALEELAKKMENKSGYAEVVSYIVSEKVDDAQKYDVFANSEKNTANRWAYKDAVALLDRAMRTDAASFGHDLCATAKMSILQKEINVQTEQISAISKPILCKIAYRNIPKLYYRIVKYSIYFAL